MTKTLKILPVLMLALFMPSFTNTDAEKFIGTYEVSVSDPAQIKLTINADHTFYYQDFSVASKKIMVKGNWTQKGKTVVLINTDSKTRFHNVWTFAENGQVAKSRKGLAFYRLCKRER